MIFDKSELNEKIGLIKAAISTNNIMPSTNGVLIKENVMTATSIELTAITFLKMSNYKSEESFIIPVAAFGVLAKVNEPEIEITFEKETKTLHIKSGKYKGKFQTVSPNEFPRIAQIKESEQEIKAEKFKELLKDVVHAVSVDVSKGVICGINLATHAGMLEVVSLDGYRLAKSAIPYDGEINIVMIKNAVDFIIKSKVSGALKISQTDKFVVFHMDEFTLIARKMSEQFIGYRELIKVEKNEKVVILNPRDLQSAIELFNETIKGIDNKKGAIKLRLASRKLVACDDKDSSNSFFTQEIEISELDGFTEEFAIGFNPRYLLDVLKVFADEERITMAFNTSVTPAYFYSEENKDRICMVLPVRIANRQL
ncbi:MAG: hypothetical protein AB9836_04890 [Aminipila sp.]